MASTPLRMTSCQAPVADYVGRALADDLRAQLDIDVVWVDDIPWQQRYAQLERGEIHLCWICGAPYVRLRDRGVDVQLVAAPVYRHPRYGDRPVYCSDVLVRYESPFMDFEDLRGGIWAFNERGSLSGYECVRGELARRGEPRGYFGAAIEAGSHQDALRLLRNGEIDAAAIDATVIEELTRTDPGAIEGLRVVHTIGPSPMPPWVVAPGVDQPLYQRLVDHWTALDKTPEGRRLLEQTLLSRFAAVADSDYDFVRDLLIRAETVRLSLGE